MKKSYSIMLGGLFATLIFTGSCKTAVSENVSPEMAVEQSFPDFYIEGHRGARGLAPENTIPSFLKAIEEGSNFIELDIQISKDQQVLVTHDPYLNRNFTLMPDGSEIPEEDAKKYLVYQMDYSEIRKFDVGSKFHSGFPEQQKIKTYIPLLGELIDSVENFTAKNDLQEVVYNVEIKADPNMDGHYQPAPDTLIRLVMDVIREKQLPNHRYYIQSFDVRQIQEVRKNYPEVVIGFLTSMKERSVEENISEIGFTPNIYSPYFKLATPELIEEVQERGMKFVPWTVNTVEDMVKLKEMGVDGLITDYPNLLSELQSGQ